MNVTLKKNNGGPIVVLTNRGEYEKHKILRIISSMTPFNIRLLFLKNYISQLVPMARNSFLQSRSETNRYCTKAHNLPPILQQVNYSSFLNSITLREEKLLQGRN